MPAAAGVVGVSRSGGAVYVGSCPVDTKSLWMTVLTVSQIEVTHAQRRYTTLLEELECEVARDLF